MRNLLFKFTLVALAAAGGVVAWQRRNETPATPPPVWPDEPFTSADKPIGGGVVTDDVTAPKPQGGDPAVGTPTQPTVTDIGSADMVTRTPDSEHDKSEHDESERDLATAAEQVDEAETDTDELDVAEPPGSPDVGGGPAADVGVVADRRAKEGADDDRPLPDPPRRPLLTARAGPADDLTQIDGVGDQQQRALNDEGITQYGQLAGLTAQQVEELQARLPEFPDRDGPDSWVDQAQRMSQPQ